MTYIDTPAATTIAIANACAFMASEIPQQLAVQRGDPDRHHHESSLRRQFRGAGFDRRDAPVGEANHAIGHLRDGGVVRDDDRGRAKLGVDLRQRFEHDDAGGDIERAGRLVAQEHRRPLGDGTRNGHALLLAARKLRREMRRPRTQVDQSRAASGVMGFSAISVTRATFSAAVRLGIRL